MTPPWIAFSAIVIALVSAFSIARAEDIQPVIQVSVYADGSVQVEGRRYDEPESLRVKFLEIESRVPRPILETKNLFKDAERPTQANELFRKAGIKVGFVTNPPSEELKAMRLEIRQTRPPN